MIGVDVVVRETLRFHTDEEIIGDAMDIGGDLGLDSLSRVEARQAIEDRLGIEISDNEWDGARTVGDAIRLAEAKVQESRT